MCDRCFFAFFFFNDTATTEIYTLSLHDALPICGGRSRRTPALGRQRVVPRLQGNQREPPDRKSTRLNSSHSQISYAVFCLKKKKQIRRKTPDPITQQVHLCIALHQSQHPGSIPT